MTTATFVDVERPVRDWLRAQAIPGTRVYVGLPNDAVFPAIEMTLLDGGVMAGEAPVADTSFSFSVWGAGTTGPDRQAATTAAWALAALLQSSRTVELDPTLVLLGARVTLGPVPRFDADGTPRYLLDAALTVRVNA